MASQQHGLACAEVCIFILLLLCILNKMVDVSSYLHSVRTYDDNLHIQKWLLPVHVVFVWVN